MSDYGIQIKGTSPILDKRPVRPLSSQSPHLSVYKEVILDGFKKQLNQLKKEALKESVLQSLNQVALVVQKH
jgi:hypothetical protein